MAFKWISYIYKLYIIFIQTLLNLYIKLILLNKVYISILILLNIKCLYLQNKSELSNEQLIAYSLYFNLKKNGNSKRTNCNDRKFWKCKLLYPPRER